MKVIIKKKLALTVYFTKYFRIYEEIFRLAKKNRMTTSQVIVSLMARGLKEHRRKNV